MVLILALLLGFLAVVALTGWVCRSADWLKLIDQPNTRSSHVNPTPRGGGIAIAAVLTGYVVWIIAEGGISTPFGYALLVGGVVMAVVGLIDDRSGLPASLRLAIQIMCIGGVVMTLPSPAAIEFGSWRVISGPVSLTVTVICLIWLVNLFNFMDGIDGIAAAEAIFVGGTSAAYMLLTASGGPVPGVDLLLAMTAVAALGFLYWNWPPARIFMGDSGSGYLGFLLGALALYTVSAGAIRPAQWLILWGAFVADSTVTLARRLLRGERPHQAHRSHAYQRLARQFDHRGSTLAFIAVNLCWLLPWFVYVRYVPDFEVWVVAVALLPLVAAAWMLGAGGPHKGS